MPKIVISDEKKQQFTVCPQTKRYIPVKTNHKLRAGLEQGRVVIILSGPQAGHRAVFLKQLDNGHLLVNGCGVNEQQQAQWTLCAVPQKHVIITSTKLDGVNVDTKDFTFSLFCRPMGLKPQQIEEFDKSQPEWLSQWQIKVDKELIPKVGKFADYLKAPFVVRPQDKVHAFKF